MCMRNLSKKRQTKFGENLLRIRLDRQVTQEMLAEAIGSHQTLIPRLESGSRECSFITLRRIVYQLGCTIDELIGSEEGD